MRSVIQAIAATCAALACLGAAAPARIEYTLTPIMADGALQAIQYDLRFRGEADGESSLRLPDDWGGQNELWLGIDALEVVSGASMTDGELPNQRVLTHRPGARIHVRYRVIQDWEGAPRAELGNTYRPVIQPGYFHLIGEASLVTPGGASTDAPVRLRVRNLPRGWAFASDLEHDALKLEDVWSSVTVGGDFRVLRDANSNVRLAIRGQWTFSDADLLNQVSGIVASQRRFWGDEASPYLVTVLQLTAPEGWLSVGGTGLNDAFAFFATADAPEAVVTRTLAHESLHTWLPARIGGMPQENEAINYWLSEGFTDFYTARLLVRDGVWTPQQFADDLNEMLRAYAQSPVRNEPNSRIVSDFWNNRDIQKLPYQRGRLLAMIWDARLRASGRDFDDVVMEMRQRAQSGDAGKAAEIFPSVAHSIGLDPSSELADRVEAGGQIILPQDILSPCGVIATRDVAIFHRGFDITETQANNNVIAGVDPALPAYAAGMRDGMVLIRRDAGEIGDSEQEIAYVVRDGETERTLRYMPRGQGAYTLQRFDVDDSLAGERLQQCVRVIGGG